MTTPTNYLTPPDELLLNMDQCAAVLAVSRQTLNTMAAKGDAPPFFKLNRRNFITASALRAWIQDKQLGSQHSNIAVLLRTAR
ncbi:MAG: helix-turn-helix domain-containing protein [Methylocystis sp.]